MNPEYIIDKNQIRMINEKYGGSLMSDAEIETALDLGRGKSAYRKIAYLWRSILVGHPFTDGNKRTALASALVFLELNGVRVADPEGRLYRSMMSLAAGKLKKAAFAEILRNLQK